MYAIFQTRSQVEPFGSFATGLYLPTSDIDVVVRCHSPMLTVSHMHMLARRLQSAGLVEDLQVIDKARVPIIKMVDSLLGIRVDLSFNVVNGVVAADVVRRELRKWPVLKPLAYIIKQFLLQRQLNEVFTGGLSSYSIIVLIISFLQVRTTKALFVKQNLIRCADASTNTSQEDRPSG